MALYNSGTLPDESVFSSLQSWNSQAGHLEESLRSCTCRDEKESCTDGGKELQSGSMKALASPWGSLGQAGPSGHLELGQEAQASRK